jgi:eukaryotic-like serine/threonine-protein kinase
VDARSDIFSFGSVLYEMVTGRRAFQGETNLAMLSAVLDKEPTPVSAIVPKTPPELEKLIARCLRKDRERRIQHMGDVKLALEELKEESDSGKLHAPTPSRRRASLWVVAALVLPMLAAGVAAVVWLATHRALPRPEPKPRRLTANPAGNPATDAHISPDGKYLAYADQAGIHLQLIDTGETRIIPPPQGVGYKITGWSPVGWFPDGTKLLAQVTSLGAEHSSVWVISLLGGAPREMHEGAFVWSLSPDGSLIAFASSFQGSDIWLMGVNGEEPRKVMTTDEGESLLSVVWSPDSRRIAYERFRNGPAEIRCSIESRDLKGGQPAVLLSDPKLATSFGVGFWWLADGRLIYSFREAVPRTGATDTNATDTNLWEIKVDPGSGRPAGKPRRITNWSDFSLAGLNATADGKRLVFRRVSAQTDVYVGDLEAGGRRLKAPPRRLTLDERADNPTTWTPDSKTVVFQSDRSGKWGIYKQALDEDSAEPLVITPQHNEDPRLSPNGEWIVYVHAAKPDDIGTSAPTQIRRVPVSGGLSELVLTTHRLSDVRCARLGPFCLVGEQTEDQKQLVFTAFDPIKGKDREMMRIATNPGFAFNDTYNWDVSPDGSQLAISYPAGENRIRLLPLRGGEPRDLVVNGWYGFYEGPDWSPDGKGFYVGASSPQGATLLYIDLEGHANALWEQKGSFATWGVPSPDGRHLAILGWTVDSNVWMLENF